MNILTNISSNSAQDLFLFYEKEKYVAIGSEINWRNELCMSYPKFVIVVRYISFWFLLCVT